VVPAAYDRVVRFADGPASPQYWRQAVEMQGKRLVEHKVEAQRLDRESKAAADPDAVDHFLPAAMVKVDASIDARLLVYAVRHLARLAELFAAEASKTNRGSARKAITDFRRAWPSIVPARDMIEHFDEYFIGEGLRRKRGELNEDATPGVTHLGAIVERDGHWHFLLYDVDLPLGKVTHAALSLAQRMGAIWANETFGMTSDEIRFQDYRYFLDL
jgi:hypothetical protein